MRGLRLRALALVLLALPLAGCTLPALPWASGETGFGDVPRPPDQRPDGPPLVFGGLVVDAVTGAPLPDATVRLDLAYVQPCRREGLVWAHWELPPDAEGRWGPHEVPRPSSDDVAFFLHVSAPGRADDVLFLGPAESRGDLRNLTTRLHPDVAVTGRAPPGTVLALDAPGFPRLAVADANGTFAFERARVENASFVAATAVPYARNLTPPISVDAPAPNATGWRLEGRARTEQGVGVPADVVAWADGVLVSAARADEAGAFALPLPPEPLSLRIEARTADGRLGGTLVHEVDGPPARREAMVLRPLC